MKKWNAAILAGAAVMALAMPASAQSYTSGTYTGTARGNSGEVKVEVTFSDSAIENVDIVEDNETTHLMYAVKKILPGRITDSQSLAVDTVSGATISSYAVINAVKDCVKQAGGDVDALTVKAEKAEQAEMANCDVVVVGAGVSGLMAANVLQNNGVDVLLIEMQDITGGSGRYSAGRLFGTLADDDYDRIYGAFMKQTTMNPQPYDETQFPNADKVKQYLEEGHELFDYLKEQMGFELAYYDKAETKVHVVNSPYEAYSDCKGFQFTEALTDDYLAAGGRLMLRTTATALRQDEAGNVIGVTAATDNGTLTIDAKYTIVATGSAAYNEEMQKIYQPAHADGEQRVISMGENGSGIQMMLDVGAKVIPDWINSVATLTTNPMLARTNASEVVTELTATQFSSSVFDSSELYVDHDGVRRGNEANSFISLSYMEPDYIDALFVVTDAAHAQELGFTDQLEEALASGHECYFKADTLEELAAAAGFDSEKFVKTVEEYNGYCEAGEDKAFGKAAEKLVAIGNGPYYAVKEYLVNRDIAGGVYTDLNRQVLNESGETIGNLFAVGFDSSRDLYASGIPGASSVGEAAVTGKVAAEYVTSLLK